MTVHEFRELRICQRLNYVYNICMSKVILRRSVRSISQKTRIVEIVYVFFTIMKLKLLVKKKLNYVYNICISKVFEDIP